MFATDPADVQDVIADWWDQGMNVPLAIVDAPFRDIGPPLLAEIRERTRRGDTTVTVVLPEFVVNRWWEHALHNQTGPPARPGFSGLSGFIKVGKTLNSSISSA